MICNRFNKGLYKIDDQTPNYFKMAEAIELLIKDDQFIEYPSNWVDERLSDMETDISIQNEYKDFGFPRSNLVKISANSREFDEVSKAFKIRKCAKYEIVEIERLQSKHLYKDYYLKQLEINYKHNNRISKTLQPQYEHRKLFHGTSGFDPKYVLCSEEGIDKRFVKQNSAGTAAGTFYGQGGYTATLPGYSDEDYKFTKGDVDDKTSRCQLIMCRVLIGKYDYGNKFLEKDELRTKKGKDCAAEYTEEEKKYYSKVQGQTYNNLNMKERQAKLNQLHGQNIRDGINTPDYHGNPETRIDSIMDDYFMITKGSKVNEPRMFVTFDNAQIYPE